MLDTNPCRPTCLRGSLSFNVHPVLIVEYYKHINSIWALTKITCWIGERPSNRLLLYNVPDKIKIASACCFIPYSGNVNLFYRNGSGT